MIRLMRKFLILIGCIALLQGGNALSPPQLLDLSSESDLETTTESRNDVEERGHHATRFLTPSGLVRVSRPRSWAKAQGSRGSTIYATLGRAARRYTSLRATNRPIPQPSATRNLPLIC